MVNANHTAFQEKKLMSLLTASERKLKLPPGVYAKEKCESCDKPILSTLKYVGPNGEDCCSKTCQNRLYAAAVERGKNIYYTDGTKVKKGDFEFMAKKKATTKTDDEDVKKKKKGKKTSPPSKKKKVKDEEEDEEEETEEEEEEEEEETEEEEEEEEEEEPKKKKKKAKADDGDGKKKKKKVVKEADPDDEYPFIRRGSTLRTAFEMAVEGTTTAKLNKLCLKNKDGKKADADVSFKRVYRILTKSGAKKGGFRGTHWKCKITELPSGDEKLKIHHIE